MTDEFDPYKPGTGLKSDFAGTIVDSTFSTDPQTGNAKVILMTVDDEGDEYPVNYWLGRDWDTYDGGVSVQHPKGDRQLFSNNATYSLFIVHAMEAGAKEVMYERLRKGLGPRHAANWLDMRFHWDMVACPAREQDEEGKWFNTTRDRLMPVKFLGLAGGTAVAVPSAPTVGADPLDVLDPVTRGKVQRSAKESATYDSFVQDMLELSDKDGNAILDHEEINRALADEKWYASLRDR